MEDKIITISLFSISVLIFIIFLVYVVLDVIGFEFTIGDIFNKLSPDWAKSLFLTQILNFFLISYTCIALVVGTLFLI